MSRTQLLLDDEAVRKLMRANVLVVGLGGVGGICAEMIARAGVGKMTIADGDVVDPSNRNRQIPALSSTHHQPKATVMEQRLLDINPELELTVINDFLKDEKTTQLLENGNFDYVVDCIDTLSPKVFLIAACVKRGIPVVSSMGAGGKVDPSKVVVCDLWDTYYCNLAKYVRKRLKRMGVTQSIPVVFSDEEIDQSKIIVTEKAYPKKSIIGTMSYMPAIFGCTAASVVIRGLMEK
ncbi:MAG: tRNA threonylcarbamoyladenosine dehydratase [Bacteroidia bacterium]